jgi:hypothetical protein
MKAWRFHAFGDMRLDDVPEPACGASHVVEPLCVQPSVTEAQLAQGIPTLASDRVQRRLEAEAPLQLFGHEFCAQVLEVGPGGDAGEGGGPRRGAGEVAVRRVPAVPVGVEQPLPQGAGDRLRPARVLRVACAHP